MLYLLLSTVLEYVTAVAFIRSYISTALYEIVYVVEHVCCGLQALIHPALQGFSTIPGEAFLSLPAR